MGQINCQCKQQQLEQRIQTIIPKYNNRKIKNRVKSILQPKQANTKYILEKISQQKILERSQNLSQNYCKLQLLGNFSKIQIEIRKKGITLGTKQSDIIMHSFSDSDQFKLQFKYSTENSQVMVRDYGLGLGVFLLKNQVQLEKQMLINYNDKFIFIDVDQDQDLLKWKLWYQGKQQSNQCLISKDQIKIQKFLIFQNSNIHHIDSNEKFWVYCNNFIKCQEGDILRCGQSFYRIQKMQLYMESSRLVFKY